MFFSGKTLHRYQKKYNQPQKYKKKMRVIIYSTIKINMFILYIAQLALTLPHKN